MQDLFFEKHHIVESSAEYAVCYVCKKGMDDGYSVTAKKILDNFMLLCEKHYS